MSTATSGQGSSAGKPLFEVEPFIRGAAEASGSELACLKSRGCLVGPFPGEAEGAWGGQGPRLPEDPGENSTLSGGWAASRHAIGFLLTSSSS
jgi:hypothetical protein